MSFSEISPYFSWIIDKLLAVSALPYHHTHLKYFRDNGIHTVNLNIFVHLSCIQLIFLC